MNLSEYLIESIDKDILLPISIISKIKNNQIEDEKVILELGLKNRQVEQIISTVKKDNFQVIEDSIIQDILGEDEYNKLVENVKGDIEDKNREKSTGIESVKEGEEEEYDELGTISKILSNILHKTVESIEFFTWKQKDDKLYLIVMIEQDDDINDLIKHII